MRRGLVLVVSLILALVAGTVAGAEQPDIAEFPDCRYCGMHRKNFAHSRMVVHHTDGSAVGVCSINCAAIEYVKDVDRLPGPLMVGDYNTKKLIRAERAFWVMGGSKPGVMTKRAKWAFAKRSDAAVFMKRHGGRPVTFDKAMEASYEDIYEDMRTLEQMKREHAEHARSRVEASGALGLN